MIPISAEYLLSTIFQYTDKISFSELKEITREIEKLTGGALVGISSDDIAFILEYHPEIFDIKNDYIIKVINADKYLRTDFMYYEFVLSIPKPINEVIKSYVKDRSNKSLSNGQD